MGEVWRARHRYLKRDAAVKFVRSDTLGTESNVENRTHLLRRFEREAQITSNLRSPHTVQIFDFGTTPDGDFYYAMELLDGVSLDDLVVRHGPLPEARVIHIIRQVCESLSEAHHHGLIHRDIKPGNLVLGRLGLDYDFVKVLDFGLVSKGTGAGSLASAVLDRALAGTPAFMAPEAISGDRVLDARSDLYSLGCVCYWLLTGELVFPGRSVAEVVASHMRDPPDPPSSRSEVPISPEMDEIVLACLAKQPESRPESARALNDRLRRCPKAAAWSEDDAARWWNLHHPGPLTSNVRSQTTESTLRTDPFAASQGIVSPVPAVTSVVVLPLANLSSDPEQEPFVLGLHDALVSELARIGALTVISRTSALAYRDTTKSVREIADELAVDAIVEGSVLRARDDVRISLRLVAAPSGKLLWAEKYDRSVGDVLSLHSEVARSVAHKVRISLTPSEAAHLEVSVEMNAACFDVYVRGLQLSYSFEETDLYRAMDHLRDAIELDPGYAPAHAALGRCYNELASYGFIAPSEALPRAASAVRRALELDPSHAEGHANLGYSMVFFNWDFENSRAEFERALELEPSSVSSLGLFGRYLSLVGEFDRAREVLERACTVDPLSPVPMMWRGWSSFMARDYGRSTRDFEEMLQKFPGFPYALLWLGASLVQQGEIERAIALASKLEELTGFSNDHNLLAILGWTWARAGRFDKTRRILDHFLALSKRRWVDPGFIATQYFALGQPEETWNYLAQAFEVRSLLLAYLPTHPFMDGGRDDARYAKLLRDMRRVSSAGQ